MQHMSRYHSRSGQLTTEFLKMAHQRLCLITGGNTGIGFEVAKQLLQRGHEVIIACRDNARAQAACERIQQVSSNTKISAVQCDLASLASVRACAEHVINTWPAKLDVLVCNAATITQQPAVTADGFDSMYQVNHLGHFLLTHLLLPQLVKSEAGRIVVVGSQLHTSVPPELTDPLFFHKLAAQQQQQQATDTAAAAAAVPPLQIPTPLQRYSLTKLYNLWFVKHLASQLSTGSSSSSSKVVVNAVAPGFVPTTELSRSAGVLRRLFMKYVMCWAPFAVTTEEAGARVAALCDGEQEGQSNGAMYSKRVVIETVGAANDAELAAQLWQQSCKDAEI